MKVHYTSIKVKYRPYEQLDNFLSHEEMQAVERNRIVYAILKGRAIRDAGSFDDISILRAVEAHHNSLLNL